MSLHTNDAIQFNDVSVTLNEQPIIKQLSGSIAKGKITTLIGPSGSGKTTLLKLCNRLISQTAGSIFIENKKIDTYNAVKLRREVGMALQSAPMIKGTVYDNLKLPRELQYSTLSLEEATSILNDVGLDESFIKKDSKNLSGGQKQRVSIARTLINRSKILLLDEITSALDPQSVKEIEDLILHINRKYHVTIIWITHHVEQAIKIGDELWLLVDGVLIEKGSPSALLASENPIVQQFIRGEKHDI